MQSGSGARLSDPVLWLALALAAPLRFAALARPSLWLDEALSARTAALPPAGILAAAVSDLHPPGYYLLLHAWTAFFPPNAAGLPGEWALRSLSAAASLALVPLAYGLGEAWAADPERRSATARAAAWIAALSPYAIDLGREARGYALLALLLAAQFALWTRLRGGRGGAAAWGGVTLVAAAGMYVHYHALLFTAALGLASLARAPGAPPRFGRRFALAALLACLAFAPWLPRVAAQAAGGVRDWVSFSHSPFVVPRTLAAFLRGGGASATELSLWMAPVLFLLWRGTRRGAGALALPMLLPLAIAYAASFAFPVFGARYFGGSAVVAWVLLARGATALEPLRTRRWAVAAALLLPIAFGIGIAGDAGEPGKRGEPWRELVRAIEDGSPRGTPVLFPFVEPFAPFAYYARPGHLRLVGAIAPGAAGKGSLSPGLPDPIGAHEVVWWVPYQESLYDPASLGRRWLADQGLVEGPSPLTAGRLTAIPFHPAAAPRRVDPVRSGSPARTR